MAVHSLAELPGGTEWLRSIPRRNPRTCPPPPPKKGQQPKGVGGGPKKHCCLRDAAPQVDTNGGSDPQMELGPVPKPHPKRGAPAKPREPRRDVNHVGTLAKCPMRWLSQCWLNLTHLSLGQHLGCSQLRKPPTQRDTSPNGWQQPGAMNHRPARVGGDPKAHQVPTPHGMAEICLSLG